MPTYRQNKLRCFKITGLGGSDCLYIRAADYLHHCYTCKMDKQALVGKLPLYVGYHWESISNEKDQEWNKIVVDILWEMVPKPVILFLSYNTNYLPALTSEGVSKFKFNERKPLCHTYVINSHVGTFPADTKPSYGCLQASKRQCTQHCADNVLLLC